MIFQRYHRFIAILSLFFYRALPQQVATFAPNNKNPFGVISSYTLEYDNRQGACGASITINTNRTNVLSNITLIQFKFEDPNQKVVRVESGFRFVTTVVENVVWQTLQPTPPRAASDKTLTIHSLRMSYPPSDSVSSKAPLRGPLQLLLTFQEQGSTDTKRAFFTLKQQFFNAETNAVEAATNTPRDLLMVRKSPLQGDRDDPNQSNLPPGLVGGIVGGVAFFGIFVVVITLSTHHRQKRLSKSRQPVAPETRYDSPGFGL